MLAEQTMKCAHLSLKAGATLLNMVPA